MGIFGTGDMMLTYSYIHIRMLTYITTLSCSQSEGKSPPYCCAAWHQHLNAMKTKTRVKFKAMLSRNKVTNIVIYHLQRLASGYHVRYQELVILVIGRP